MKLLFAIPFTVIALLSQAAPLAVFRVLPQSSSAFYEVDASIEASKETLLTAQVSGKITHVWVEAGDTVKKGQRLLSIDPIAAEQNDAALKAASMASAAALRLAEQQFLRQKQLYEAHFISKAALDQAQASLDVARAQLKSQQMQAAASQTQTQFHQVLAPFDGVIAAKLSEQGNTAMPGLPLFKLLQPNSLRMEAQIPSDIARHLSASNEAMLILPDQSPLRLKNIQVLPTIDAHAQTARIRADLPPVSLKPGSLAKLRLGMPASQAQAGLWIPQQAVWQQQTLQGVYVVSADGRAQLRFVRLGKKVGGQVEVLSGLIAGENIALSPLAALQGAQHD